MRPGRRPGLAGVWRGPPFAWRARPLCCPTPNFPSQKRPNNPSKSALYIEADFAPHLPSCPSLLFPSGWRLSTPLWERPPHLLPDQRPRARWRPAHPAQALGLRVASLVVSEPRTHTPHARAHTPRTAGVMLSISLAPLLTQGPPVLDDPMPAPGPQFTQTLQGPQTSPRSGGGRWVTAEPQGLEDRRHEALVAILPLEGGLCPRHFRESLAPKSSAELLVQEGRTPSFTVSHRVY